MNWIELHYWIIWNLNASMSPIGHIWTERMRKEIVLLGGLFVQSIIHDFRTGFYCIIVLKDNFFQMIGFFLSTHHSSSIHDITSQKAVVFLHHGILLWHSCSWFFLDIWTVHFLPIISWISCGQFGHHHLVKNGILFGLSAMGFPHFLLNSSWIHSFPLTFLFGHHFANNWIFS